MVTQEPAVEQRAHWDGPLWRKLLHAGTARLERHHVSVNDLNVFPVPDGDTGTNMLLTMRAAVGAVDQRAHEAAGTVRQAARGALMGARGNSGVILSQILAGMAQALEQCKICDGNALAQALTAGAKAAHGAVAQPVEGTILTVARATGRAAEEAARETGDLAVILRHATTAASQAVRETQHQLRELREAGVVDAGGEGYRLVLEGMLQAATGADGDALAPLPAAARPETSPTESPTAEPPGSAEWGYCTQFLISGDHLDLAAARRAIESQAQWAVVVGENEIIRVHGHTDDPGQLLSYAVTVGHLGDIHIEDMDQQVLEQEARQAQQPSPLPAAPRPAPAPIATVAVVAGDGLVDIFRSLGSGGLVAGGQSMNPSTADLLAAIQATEASQVLVLPNNKNVVLSAEQAAALAQSDTAPAVRVSVVPTKTVADGIAAQLAFNPEAPLEENARQMAEAAAHVRTIELTRAVRATTFGEVGVRQGDAIALLDDRIVASGTDEQEVLRAALGHLGEPEAELITVYTGEDARAASTDAIAQIIQQRFPQGEVDIQDGGQPHYPYIIGLE